VSSGRRGRGTSIPSPTARRACGGRRCCASRSTGRASPRAPRSTRSSRAAGCCRPGSAGRAAVSAPRTRRRRTTQSPRARPRHPRARASRSPPGRRRPPASAPRDSSSAAPAAPSQAFSVANQSALRTSGGSKSRPSSFTEPVVSPASSSACETMSRCAPCSAEPWQKKWRMCGTRSVIDASNCSRSMMYSTVMARSFSRSMCCLRRQQVPLRLRAVLLQLLRPVDPLLVSTALRRACGFETGHSPQVHSECKIPVVIGYYKETSQHSASSEGL
jgi:hypothetical protein